jgi:hypothetical protein
MIGKESRSEKNYCPNCGLVLIDKWCPICRTEFDEEDIVVSSISLKNTDARNRSMGIAGIVLLFVGGLLPNIVSASESNYQVTETTVTDTSTSITTSTVTAPLSDTTIPVVSQPSQSASSQDSPVATNRVPTKPPRSTTTTTTLPPIGSHGKREGRTTLWSSADNRYQIYVNVGRFTNGEEGVTVFGTFPPAKTIDPGCSASSAPIYERKKFSSLDGVNGTEGYTTLIPRSSGDDYCGTPGVGLWSLYSTSSGWRTTNYKRTETAPPAEFVKFQLTNKRTNEVIESPWVLVDPNAIP